MSSRWPKGPRARRSRTLDTVTAHSTPQPHARHRDCTLDAAAARSTP
ncbi:hypothetical protein I545_3250 [Mycobacterium kansasii 662]|uniref:Uncharacterized protein n=1 Tax=Mycobacterium kansasii 662 TaxID=1299326 RepID=X7ZDY2_MYCKA|nr:hypothetical protein I545_3250 [Mycobacterium kansasii 662]